MRRNLRCSTEESFGIEEAGGNIVCDLEVVTLIAEMLLLLSRSIPIDKFLVRNEQRKAIETK